MQSTSPDLELKEGPKSAAHGEEQKSEFIQEGRAKIHIRSEKELANNKVEEQEAFYNPVMIFNRDISILVIQTYAELLKKEQEEKSKPFKGIHILDALSASGLRTIRFLKEINPSLIQKVHANDLSEGALKHMRENFKLNELDESKVVQHQEDANILMYKSKDNVWPEASASIKYDVIDLDPYGTAVPFLDTAVQAIKEGGLLCVTCTDLKVLCGPDYHKCFYMYGVTRARMVCHQENAVRIVLYSISSIANKYSKYIVPYISYQSEYYLRVFVRVFTSKSECAKSMLKYGHVYYCPESSYFTTHTLGHKNEKGALQFNKMKLDLSHCPMTGEQFAFNGPIWFDPLNDFTFVKLLQERLTAEDQQLELASKKRILGVLEGILQQGELAKYPLSFSIEKIGKYLHTSTPSKRVLEYFLHKHGFKVASCYMFRNLWKSDAPAEVFFDFMKAWRQHYCKQHKTDYFQNITEDSGAYFCFNKAIKYNADFDVEIPKSSAKKVTMFYPNPEKNWGPRKKATDRKVIDKVSGEEPGLETGENGPTNPAQDTRSEDPSKTYVQETPLEDGPSKRVKKD